MWLCTNTETISAFVCTEWWQPQ